MTYDDLVSTESKIIVKVIELLVEWRRSEASNIKRAELELKSGEGQANNAMEVTTVKCRVLNSG